MLIIELNEFDPKFLREASELLDLKNIKKILKLNHSKTTTLEKIEHHGLDPWVQWVSIHTGKPFKEHKISRLGQTNIQKDEQIWNKFDQSLKMKCGIWGVINAPKGNLVRDHFFLPDPWSFEENAFPKEINNFLALPRYMSKNYLSPNKIKLIIPSLKMIYFILKNKGGGKTRKIIKLFLKSLTISGLNLHTLSSLLDYISTLYFIDQKNKFKTDFNIIFLNHIAHLQHQFWSEVSNLTNEMKLGLIVCDEIMKLLFNEINKGEILIVMNGLKQTLISEKSVNVYRQKDPTNFFKTLGICFSSIEQNMTNDGILIFNNKKYANIAENRLSKLYLKINKQKLLYIERLSELKIFYQIEISDDITSKESIIFENEYICDFFNIIEHVCKRTGEHIQEGDIFYKNINFPKTINNHEIFNKILESKKI